jgi:hypothetical protein
MFGRVSKTVLFLVSSLLSFGQEVRLTKVASVEQLYAFNYDLPSASASSSRSALVPPTRTARVVSSPLSTRYDNELEDSSSASPESPATNGWSVYNPRTEFSRQGVGSRTRGWRFTDINKDYGFSPTYPAKLVVPSRIGDAVLQYAAKYRSKARIPALTYLHWANNVSSTPDTGRQNELMTRHRLHDPHNPWSASREPGQHKMNVSSNVSFHHTNLPRIPIPPPHPQSRRHPTSTDPHLPI